MTGTEWIKLTETVLSYGLGAFVVYLAGRVLIEMIKAD